MKGTVVILRVPSVEGGDANRENGYVDYVVEVDFPDSDVECVDSSRHLWLYRTDDYLDLTNIAIFSSLFDFVLKGDMRFID